MPLIVKSDDWDELRYAAEMTERQFAALRSHIHPSRVLAEIKGQARLTAPTLAKSASKPEIAKWLLNGWNTENLLRLTGELLEGGANAAVLQWTFPQAYYSAYSLCYAFFNVAGFTERTHAGVIKKFGELVAKGEYPETISFHADGNPNTVTFHRIEWTGPVGTTSLSFDPQDPSSVAKHICQFLRATRQTTLAEKRADFKFKTKGGKAKQKLDATDWARVSTAMGVTSLLSILYRKRIKANYRQIDTYTLAEINAATVHDSVLRVVTALNFIHEVYIAAAIGWEEFERIATTFLDRCDLERVRRRLPHIKALVI